MIDFKKPSRRMQIQLEPILRTFIAQRYSNITYGRVRTAVAEVDDSTKALPRKDQVLPAKVTMDGKAWQRAVSRAAKFLQNTDAFLHMRPEEPMWLVLIVSDFELQTPERMQKPRVVEGDGVRVPPS